MSSTRTQSQLCTATPTSSFAQCQVSFRLLPSSVATSVSIDFVKIFRIFSLSLRWKYFLVFILQLKQ